MVNKRVAVSVATAALCSCPGHPLQGRSGPGQDGVDDAVASTSSQAIVNGAACGPDVEPTAMAVMIDALIDDGSGGTFERREPICTGTLIAPDVVMIAAHCVDPGILVNGDDEVERVDFYVTFEADLSRFTVAPPPPIPVNAVHVRAFVAHEGFVGGEIGESGIDGVESDIALLFLDRAITTVRPEIVITAQEATQLAVGDAVTIAGWGQRDGESNDPGGIKQCGTTTINELGEALMQIGSDRDSVRKCAGDSGGPTFRNVETDAVTRRRVIGVTARAYAGAGCTSGLVDTRVDAFLDFIDDELSSRCASGGRAWCDVPGIIPADFEFTIDPAEGEGEGEADGEDEDDVGCAAMPGQSTVGLALLTLVLRHRRR